VLVGGSIGIICSSHNEAGAQSQLFTYLPIRHVFVRFFHVPHIQYGLECGFSYALFGVDAALCLTEFMQPQSSACMFCIQNLIDLP
jgi:hypothetical protein